MEESNIKAMREALENIAEYAKAAACHTEDAHLLGYLNQIAMWAEDALSAPPRNCDRISDAVIQSLRDKKLEMAGEIAAKEAEIVRLRELVSELLNKLVINHCIGCQVDDCDGCVYYAQNEAVAAKAREMIGGAK